jgi:hypothetical protein
MRRQSEQIVLAPTDLGNYLACRHLSAPDLAAADESVTRPVRFGPVLDVLQARGHAHEAAYVAFLEGQGLAVARLGDAPERADSDGDPNAETLAPMRPGVDVIYQATLSDGHWAGRATFLRRVETPGELGDWSYEVYDTKPDAPRGMTFLYDPHRFNVATSRAMALCILVGSPALFAPECRTPAQIKMANGFCRYLELAETGSVERQL